MLILGLDIATGSGWGAYDTDRHPSSTLCGVFSVSLPKEIKGAERRRLMRPKMDEYVCGLIDRFRPDVACIEAPLQYIDTGGSRKPAKAPLFRGQNLPSGKVEDSGPAGPNAETVLLLNQLFAVAFTVCSHKCDRVFEVPPTTWQRLTKGQPGDTKTRSMSYCQALGIQLPGDLNKKERGDAADAAVIAQWCAGHLQTLKTLERARAA